MVKKILLVDDHPAIRASIGAELLKKNIAEQVFEAGNSEEGFDQAMALNPDLIVMDISLYGASGIELTKKILQKNPGIKIVMLSMYSKVIYITESLKAGAKGYILKEADMESIMEGIKKVISGETYVDSRISSKVIASLISPEEDLEQPEDSTYDTLSSREQEILRLLAEGREIRDIAKELCISSKTVINHRTNIMQKLNCSNMVELIKYAIHIGLVDA
ncbi:MAG: response regulator transcription factor [Spirochaetia bacterium]|nr:response regulator transcription factor [Spirochaetia bacterium]MBP5739958.1 response regulator transcription factor [Spirochaetia bacterium]